jgi:hypothetical protein
VIILDRDDYLESTELMEIGLGDEDRLLGSKEIVDFRSVIGSVGYIAATFIPGLLRKRLCSGDFMSIRLCGPLVKKMPSFVLQKTTTIHTFRPGVESLWFLPIRQDQMKEERKVMDTVLYV